jgi:N-sulfoglucosamine sulfohydrolase
LGYITGIIGKVHVGPDEVYSWSVRYESGTRDVNWVAEKASDFFAACAGREHPFFLTIGFIDPHRDTSRGGFGNDMKCDGLAAGDASPETVSVPGYLPDLPEVRQELTEYYHSIERMDHGVGLVMKNLAQQGLTDDTLVLFLSDNGAPFMNSKTTLYDAGIHLPLIICSPEHAQNTVNPNLVSYIDLLPTWLDWAGGQEPAQIKPASNAEQHVAATRLATERAMPTPSRLGRSLLPILDQSRPLDAWQRVFGSHTFHEITNYYPTRFIRTVRYKYHRNVAWQLDFPFSADNYGSLTWEGIRNSQPAMIGPRSLKAYIQRPPEELYDLQADPHEINNLSGDSNHRQLLLQFRQAMIQWQRDTQDPWLFQDGVSVRAIQGYIDAGLQVPDRFDLDLDVPGNRY